jgi:predicted dehydrogenase
LKVGIIGAGLMGRETASALGRWYALTETTAVAELVAVCDSNPETLAWYDRVPTVKQKTPRYQDLLMNPEVEVVYVALPHNLHESMYVEVLRAGKDLLAEKPFGIDLLSCERIYEVASSSGRFVRCSSEFPFYPLIHRAYKIVLEGIGTPISGRCAFLHSSDLDENKPINWKRQAETCGKIGVMGDLGLHVCHLPFRLGIKPKSVYAQLQNLIPTRPDGKGGTADCDTWDNALLHCNCDYLGAELPFTFETKRIAPGEMNTWEFELIGTTGGVSVSTKQPKTVRSFEFVNGEQRWVQTDIGSSSPFKTITGEIFETGFSDAILQMWAAFEAERSGNLGNRFGCATPSEALLSHQLFDAAYRSHQNQEVVKL